MATGSDWQTSTTLLRRLRRHPTDEAAWARFVDRYGRLLYRWCRQWGLQEADAEDVTQNVLVELARQLRTFEYDQAGSFRGWLRTIASRAWGRYLEVRQRDRVKHSTASQQLLNEAAGADLTHHLDAESDRELLELAMNNVRLRVQPHTWEAFRLLAIEQRSGAEAAAHLQMKVGAVFVARSKVQKMLREEVGRIEQADEEAGR